MKEVLNILSLEDNQKDEELVQATLEGAGIECRFEVVESRSDFVSALEKGNIDLILADYSLPEFDGMSALKISQERCPDTPFIFVTGSMGEEWAVESLKKGATDYVLKDKLYRLVPAIQRALQEVEEQKERRRLENELRQRLDKVEKMNKLMVGRELKMEELRKEIKRLKARIEELEGRQVSGGSHVS